MYTLQNAATVLGVSMSTIKSWIAKDNIKVEIIETDRKRVYLRYDDILSLADKHKPQKKNLTDQEKSSPDMIGLYSIEEVAKLLGIHYRTAIAWIGSSNIKKKIIITDRKRAYISYSDLVALAEKHNHTIAYDKVKAKQDSDTQGDSSSQEEKLYTVADAALFLGVTAETVRRWLSMYNIEKKTIETDRVHIYIAYRDVMMLASKRKREGTYALSMSTNIREIRYRLEKIEAGILNLEQYIKRSIYVGR